MTSWANRISQMKAHGPNYMSVKFPCQSITRLGLVAVSFRLNLTTLQPKSRKNPRFRGRELTMVPLRRFPPYFVHRLISFFRIFCLGEASNSLVFWTCSSCYSCFFTPYSNRYTFLCFFTCISGPKTGIVQVHSSWKCFFCSNFKMTSRYRKNHPSQFE